MSYKVQFLGLVCFYRDGEGQIAMLPDGREPGVGIEPHLGSIAIDPDAILDVDGWDQESRESGTFLLEPCSIAISGLDTRGTLDTSRHEGRLPRLGVIDKNFYIDPATAQTIATVPIRQGRLEAYLVPKGTAVMSQLDVPYDGQIRITVTPKNGGRVQTIDVRPETEIAITNTSASGYRAADDHEGHFRIYAKLSSRPVDLKVPQDTPEGLPESPSEHFLFTECVPISLTAACSNTGCCP